MMMVSISVASLAHLALTIVPTIPTVQTVEPSEANSVLGFLALNKFYCIIKYER